MLPVSPKVIRHVNGDHPGALAGCRNVDGFDAGMGDLAAEKGGVQHPRQFDVVDEQRLPGEKPSVLIAFDGGSEIARRHHEPDRIMRAALIAASTIC